MSEGVRGPKRPGLDLRDTVRLGSIESGVDAWSGSAKGAQVSSSLDGNLRKKIYETMRPMNEPGAGNLGVEQEPMEVEEAQGLHCYGTSPA